MRPFLEADRDKIFIPKWKIIPALSACGGDLAWCVQTPGGTWLLGGCTCHSSGPLKPNGTPFLVGPKTSWTAGSPCHSCGSQQTGWVPLGGLIFAYCFTCRESAS